MSPTQTKVCSVRPMPSTPAKPARTKTNPRQSHCNTSHQDRRSHRPRHDIHPRNCSRQNKNASRVQKITPASSRSSTPVSPIHEVVTRETSNKLQTEPRKTEYVFVHPGSENIDMNPITLHDTASCIVSDQKIKSTYEKPRERNGTTIYGKLTTKIVTITVTTTIATTEITHPDEGAAYAAALERQMASAEGCGAQKPDPLTTETVFQNSKKEAAVDRDLHERFHRQHHLQATQAALPVKKAKSEP